MATVTLSSKYAHGAERSGAARRGIGKEAELGGRGRLGNYSAERTTLRIRASSCFASGQLSSRVDSREANVCRCLLGFSFTDHFDRSPFLLPRFLSLRNFGRRTLRISPLHLQLAASPFAPLSLFTAYHRLYPTAPPLHRSVANYSRHPRR